MCRMRGNECCGSGSGNQSFPFAVDHGGCLYVCYNVAMVASLACTPDYRFFEGEGDAFTRAAAPSLLLPPRLLCCDLCRVWVAPASVWALAAASCSARRFWCTTTPATSMP